MSPVYKGAPMEAKRFADQDLDLNGRFDQWLRYLDLVHAASRQVCQESGAQFIDVGPFFEQYLSSFGPSDYYKQRFLLFVDRMHFAEQGNRLLAGAVYEQIKDKL